MGCSERQHVPTALWKKKLGDISVQGPTAGQPTTVLASGGLPPTFTGSVTFTVSCGRTVS